MDLRWSLADPPARAVEGAAFAFLVLAAFRGAPLEAAAGVDLPAAGADAPAAGVDVLAADAFAVPFFLEGARALLERAGERSGSAGNFRSSALRRGFTAGFGFSWPEAASRFGFRAGVLAALVREGSAAALGLGRARSTASALAGDFGAADGVVALGLRGVVGM